MKKVAVPLTLTTDQADVLDALRVVRGNACLQELAGLLCGWLNEQSNDPQVALLVRARRRRRAGLSVIEGGAG